MVNPVWFDIMHKWTFLSPSAPNAATQFEWMYKMIYSFGGGAVLLITGGATQCDGAMVCDEAIRCWEEE